MSKPRFCITAHPIYVEHQVKLGIYDNSYVKSISVGKVLSALVEKGHKNVHMYIDKDVIHIHCAER